MRKVFRMQYEPCSGQCYTGGDDSPINKESFKAIGALKTDKNRLESFITKLTKAHEPLCGNEEMRLGVDYDELVTMATSS